MNPVCSAREVLEIILRVKKDAASGFCTNFYAEPDKVASWVARRELVHHQINETAFFLRRDRDFWHLYFCAPNPLSLGRRLGELPMLQQAPVVLDFLHQPGRAGELPGLFKTVGLRPYARLLRLGRVGQAAPAPEADTWPVILASPADAPAILGLLEASFDRYAEQLPLMSEIETAVQNQGILIIKEAGALAALLYFETHGQTSMLRYWLVGQAFRARRFGAALLRRYLTLQSAVRRLVLWVLADNQDALVKYQHYGYAPDGLVDLVFVNAQVLG